jgi:TPR repeat protein
VLSGNTLTLTGVKVTPPPAPDKRFSLDVLTLTMSRDAQTLDGTWVDQDNSQGLVSIQQLNPDGAGSAPGGPWGDIVADANEAIEAATRTGSTKTFLSRAISNRSKRWVEAARNSVPEAHWLIGCCYENGIGVPAPDLRAAFQSYSRAAEQNYGPALNDMGRCYARGSGCEKDMTHAVQYYRRAAEKVRAGAWYNLGACHEQGVGGLPQDLMKAAQCYARAKALGYKLADKALDQVNAATPSTAPTDTKFGVQVQ